jgi:2-amino-4-hydroxy-6-hydroxymethyldihydropteridine diphosphokinase
MFEMAVQLGGNSAHTPALFGHVLSWLSGNGVVTAGSSLYETPPWGYSSERNFLNAVILWKTDLRPEPALVELLALERRLGRMRSTNSTGYQDRSIDLDILLCNDLVLATDELILPHPRMAERRFVLEPLNELMPDWIHPIHQKTIYRLLSDCSDRAALSKIKEWKNWAGII